MADAAVALRRISSFLTAEELAEPYKVDPNSKFAIEVEGSFQWETAYKATTDDAKGAKFQTGKGKHGAVHGAKAQKEPDDIKQDTKAGRKRGFFKKSKQDPVLPLTAPAEEKEEAAADKEKSEDKPFELLDVKLQIQKGAFVAIVGHVGSGKVCVDVQKICHLLTCTSELSSASSHR